MTNAMLYSVDQKEGTKVLFPAEFAKETAKDSIAQAFHVYRERAHTGHPQVLTRGQVAFTTKKLYRQKHTGNARHGSKRAPIFVGGGVTHGPKGLKTVHFLSKSLRSTARMGAMSIKLANSEIAFIDIANINKTKEAAKLITLSGAKNAVVAITKANWDSAKAFRNLKDVLVLQWENLNAYQILTSHMLLVDSAVLPSGKKETVKEVKSKTTKSEVKAKPAKKTTKKS